MILRGLGACLALLCCVTAWSADVSLESARAQFVAMHTEEAQRQFETLRLQNPDDAEVLYNLGYLQLRQYHRKAAVKLMRRAVELKPDVVAYRIGACEALGAYIDDVPFYRQIGLAREVFENLKAGLALDPRSIEVHDGLMKFYLGAPALMGGGHDKAVTEAAKIAVLNPSRGYVATGLIAVHDRRYADAERDFRAAIQIAPNDTLPRYELGKVQQAQKHFDAAFATFEEVMQLLPAEPAAYYHYANTAVLAKRHIESGVEKIRAYIARGPGSDNDPSLVEAYQVQGHLAELESKLDLARSAYQTALRMDPDSTATAAALRKLD